MSEFLLKLFHDEEGQGMAEYGLILALIAIVVIIALTALGTALKGRFEKVTEALQ